MSLAAVLVVTQPGPGLGEDVRHPVAAGIELVRSDHHRVAADRNRAPKSSPKLPSEAVSLAAVLMVAQPEPGSVNTYAAPLPPVARCGLRSDHHRGAGDRNRAAEILARRAIGRGERGGLGHVRPTGPGLSEHVGRPRCHRNRWFAPTTTVSPLIETERPKSSPATPSDAVSLAVWVMSPKRSRTQ